MIRKVLAALSVVIACSGLTACNDGSKPEDVAKAYVSATKGEDWTKAYGLLSTADRAAIPLEVYRSRAMTGPMNRVERDLNKGNSEVRVSGLSLDGTDPSKATAEVEYEHVDIDVLIDASGRIPTNGPDAWFLSDHNSKVAAQILRDEYVGQDELPLTTEMQTVRLVREHGRWRVFADLAQEKVEQKRHERYGELLQAFQNADTDTKKLKAAKALVAFAPKDESLKQVLKSVKANIEFKQSVNKEKAAKLFLEVTPIFVARKSSKEIVALVKQAVALDPENPTYQSRLKQAQANAAYLPNVKLSKVEFTPQSEAASRMPEVTFNLQNVGTKDVSSVAVRLRFLGPGGSVQLEMQRWIFLYNKSNRDQDWGDAKPLAANGRPIGRYFGCIKCVDYDVTNAEVSVSTVQLSEFDR